MINYHLINPYLICYNKIIKILYMYEIELKYKFNREISKKDFVIALEDIIKQTNWSASNIQKDMIFRKKKYINKKTNIGEKIFRIRQSQNEKLLTLKIPEKQSLTCIEFESKIDNISEFKKILDVLGYKHQITIEKDRIYTKYKNLVLCFDKVYNLGSFIEIELISNTKNNIKNKNNILTITEILSKLKKFNPISINDNYVDLSIKN
jgi:predicted adenylyl cyclase CyaB